MNLGDIYGDSIQMYLREIGKSPLLKSAEEVELAKRVEKGDAAARKKIDRSQSAFGGLYRQKNIWVEIWVCSI